MARAAAVVVGVTAADVEVVLLEEEGVDVLGLGVDTGEVEVEDVDVDDAADVTEAGGGALEV